MGSRPGQGGAITGGVATWDHVQGGQESQRVEPHLEERGRVRVVGSDIDDKTTESRADHQRGPVHWQTGGEDGNDRGQQGRILP